MHFPPSVWGPFFWHTVHIVALGYPKNPTYTDKKCAKEFYESLAYLLPCSICREHYREHLKKSPITTFLDSRTDLIKWTIQIHNHVNKMLGKLEWTLEEVLTYYEKVGERNRSPVWTKEDMNEVDYRSFIKGCMAGGAIAAAMVGVYYVMGQINS
jgi:hypothetical protein